MSKSSEKVDSEKQEVLGLEADSSLAIPEAQLTDIGILNGGLPSQLFSKIPCTVGYSYLRFEVDGNIKPCCIAKYPVGHISKNDWRLTWHSVAMAAFRNKTAKINKDLFHLSDPEWLFCQQCSHITLNKRNYAALTR